MVVLLLLAWAALLVGLEEKGIPFLLNVLGLLAIPALVLCGVLSNDDGGRSVEDLTVALDGLGGYCRGRSVQLVQYRWVFACECEWMNNLMMRVPGRRQAQLKAKSYPSSFCYSPSRRRRRELHWAGWMKQRLGCRIWWLLVNNCLDSVLWDRFWRCDLKIMRTVFKQNEKELKAS